MTLRVSGLATGMDTDAIIKQMMNARRVPANKLAMKKQTLEWQRDDYKSINSKLLDFRNNKLFEFKKESTLSSKKVDMSGFGDSITVTPTSNAVNGTYNIEVESLATAASMVTKTSWNGETSKFLKDGLSGLPASVSIKFNTKEFTFNTADETLDSIISKINNDPTAGVTVFYKDGRMSITSKDTGSKSVVVTGELADKLFVNDAANSNAPGTNAKVKINGISTTQSSNTFTVNGLNITLNGENPINTPTTIQVTSDVSKIMDSIKGFINDYNDLLKTLTDKVNEDRNRTFTPLTKEQKEDMKDKEIEQWESKAKSGMLKNDGILTSLISNLRSSVFTSVNTGSSKYTNLSSLGITTGSYLENGKLYLSDENKLREALEKEPEAVMAMFTVDNGSVDGKNKKGVAEQMYDSLFTSITDLSKKAGTSRFSALDNFKLDANSVMGKQLTGLDTQISTWNKKLATLEANYYKQFTAMEKTISKYNSQSAYLMNAMGQG